MKKDRRSMLEKEIDAVLLRMSKMDRLSDDYAKLVKHLEILYAARGKNYEPRKRISPDTLLMVGANILGIALILGYEQVNAVTTKALGFVIRGRV